MVERFLSMWGDKGVPFDVFLRDAPIMAHSIDQDGTLINVSNFWADRLKYNPLDMIGRPSIEFLTPESRRMAVSTYIPKFMSAGRMSNVRYKFMTSDGDIVPVIMSAQGIHDGTRARSLAVMFDNGVAQRINDIADTISAAVTDLDSIAAGLESEQAGKLERIIASLKTTQSD